VTSSLDEPLDRSERAWRWIFAVGVLVILGFGVWCVELIVSARALRQELEGQIGWLRDLDHLNLLLQRTDETPREAPEDDGDDDPARLFKEFSADVRTATPSAELLDALDALETTLLDKPDALAAGEQIDGLRRQIRGANGRISGELGGAWEGLNLAALASLLFAVIGIVIASVARKRSYQARVYAHRLSRSEALNRAIIELAGDVIMTTGEEGTIEAINRAGVALFKLGSASTLVGEPLERVLPKVGPHLQHPPSGSAQLEARRADGSTFPAALSLAPLAHESTERRIVVLRDISAEEQIKETMRTARDTALMAAEAKSDFLAGMSHELRTPLTAIIGFSDLLLEDAVEEGHEERAADLSKILKSSDMIINLIDDILDLAKIEAGRIDLSIAPLNLYQAMHDIRDTAELLAKKRSNRLVFDIADGLAALIGDRRRLHQILLNLLSNAAKYTSGGKITLRVHQQRREGATWILFEVRDTGIGISSEAQDRLFTAFERGDHNAQRHFRGTGLGLAISKRLTELMGGTIGVESTLGEGTSFTVALPSSPLMPSS